MYTISVINLKGGVGKTTTTLALADVLSGENKQILVVDNDKQGNASRTYSEYNKESMLGSHRMLMSAEAESNIRTPRGMNPENSTAYINTKIIPCNLYMKQAETELLNDMLEYNGKKQEQGKTHIIPKHERYKYALAAVQENFDYCIIDNPPDIGISVVNALVASDGIIIPVNLDNYSLDGLEELTEQIKQIKALNPKAKLLGCLITDFEKTDTSEAAERWLREKSGQPVFYQRIRHSKKAKDAPAYHMPITRYSIRSGAAQDYKRFTRELLEMIEKEVADNGI